MASRSGEDGDEKLDEKLLGKMQRGAEIAGHDDSTYTLDTLTLKSMDSRTAENLQKCSKNSTGCRNRTVLQELSAERLTHLATQTVE